MCEEEGGESHRGSVYGAVITVILEVYSSYMYIYASVFCLLFLKGRKNNLCFF